MRRISQRLLAVLSALASGSCVSSYGVPRTTPAGHVAQTLTLETIIDPQHGNEGLVIMPGIPALNVRVGVVERLELNLRLNAAPGADLKLLGFKSRAFDAALEAGTRVLNLGESPDSLSHGTLLLGLNQSEETVWVLSPGVLYRARGEADQVGWRLGVGVSLRVPGGLAVQPELTYMRGFSPDDEQQFVLFGVGLSTGALPDYSDVRRP